MAGFDAALHATAEPQKQPPCIAPLSLEHRIPGEPPLDVPSFRQSAGGGGRSLERAEQVCCCSVGFAPLASLATEASAKGRRAEPDENARARAPPLLLSGHERLDRVPRWPRLGALRSEPRSITQVHARDLTLRRQLAHPVTVATFFSVLPCNSTCRLILCAPKGEAKPSWVALAADSAGRVVERLDPRATNISPLCCRSRNGKIDSRRIFLAEVILLAGNTNVATLQDALPRLSLWQREVGLNGADYFFFK
ncbi:hypothetical protein MTO96_000775 [Rhipicephalus appendiculatus]